MRVLVHVSVRVLVHVSVSWRLRVSVSWRLLISFSLLACLCHAITTSYQSYRIIKSRYSTGTSTVLYTVGAPTVAVRKITRHDRMTLSDSWLARDCLVVGLTSLAVARSVPVQQRAQRGSTHPPPPPLDLHPSLRLMRSVSPPMHSVRYLAFRVCGDGRPVLRAEEASIKYRKRESRVEGKMWTFRIGSSHREGCGNGVERAREGRGNSFCGTCWCHVTGD